MFGNSLIRTEHLLINAESLDVFGFFLYPLPGIERQQVAGNGFLLRPAGGY